MPADLHPRVVVAQQALIDVWRQALRGASRIGWKIGHDIPEVQDVAGTQPVVGYLTSATVLAQDGSYAAGDCRALRAETEAPHARRRAPARACDRDASANGSGRAWRPCAAGTPAP